MNKSYKNLRQKRFERGFCTGCGKNPLDTKRFCFPCLEKGKENRDARSAAYISLGLCSQCGNNPLVSEVLCQFCLNRKKKINIGIKEMVFDYYGGCICVNCGIKDPYLLTLDHVNNDGNIWRKKLSTGSGGTFYNWLIKNNFPEELELQVLCFNCNFYKNVKGFLQKYK